MINKVNPTSQSQVKLYPQLENSRLDQLNILQVQKFISFSERLIKEQNDSEHHRTVLVMGDSGIGKSTAIILLNGRQVLGFHHGNPILFEKDPSKDLKSVKIAIQPHTSQIYPAALQLKYAGGKKGKVILWDIPGVDKNKGLTQNLINTYFLHRITEFQQQINLIFTLDYINIQEFGKKFEQLVRSFENVDSIIKGVALMITKAPIFCNQEIILQTFQEQLLLPQFQNNSSYKLFLENVVSGKIPLILVKVPNLGSGNVKKANAKDVTHQYAKLIEETYKIVTNRLKSVSFPQLKSAAMTTKQIQKCKPIVTATQEIVQKQINIINQQLNKLITNPYKNVAFSQEIKQVANCLSPCKKISSFVQQIMKILNFSKNEKSAKDKYDQLTMVFEQYQFLCQKDMDINKCTPMVIIRNQYIVAKFLNSISISQTNIKMKWKNQSELLDYLFDRIDPGKLISLLNIQEKSIIAKLKEFILAYFYNQIVVQIEKKPFYEQLYCDHHLTVNFLTKSEAIKNKFQFSINYFIELRKRCIGYGIGDETNYYFNTIIKLLELTKKKITLQIDEDFIKVEIKDLLERKQKNLQTVINQIQKKQEQKILVQQKKREQHLNKSKSLANQDQLDQLQEASTKEINIQLVTKAISEGQNIIQPQINTQNIVLFWGFSGVGKSSAVILLSGQQVLGYHNPNPILIQKYPSNNKKNVRIQVKVKGGTIYPAALQLKYSKGTKGKVKLWDMPGLGENRGITQSIINSYFIHRIFQLHKQVKLIFTFDFVNIDPSRKALNFQKNLQDLTTILGHFDSYLQGIALMITKVPQHGNQEVVLQCLKKILELPQFQNNSSYKLFLENVVSGKIPLILVKVPNLGSGNVKKANAKDVTHQYAKLIEETYKIVTNRLKSVSFPQLKSAAMTTKQIQKCKPIVTATQEIVQKQFDIITQNLKDYVGRPYKNISFSQDIEQATKLLFPCQMMSAFVSSILQMPDFNNQQKDKNKIKHHFQQIQKLFQNNNFLCEKNAKGEKKCIPMEVLNNQYIIIRFLNNLSIYRANITMKWNNQSAMFIDFFNKIKKIQLKELIQKQSQLINAKLKQFIKIYFQQQYINNFQNESFYQQWTLKAQIFPLFVQATTTLDQSRDSVNYFEELRTKCINLQLSNHIKLKNIIKILQLNRKYLSKDVNQQFIQDYVKDIFYSQGNQLISRQKQESQKLNRQQVSKNLDHFHKINQIFEQKKDMKSVINENSALKAKATQLQLNNRKLQSKILKLKQQLSQKVCSFCCFGGKSADLTQ